MKATYDELFLALLIKKTHSLRTAFDEQTVSFFEDLYRRCRPDHFPNDEINIVSGDVEIHFNHRCLRFHMSDGTVWFASIMKISPDKDTWCKVNIDVDRTIFLEQGSTTSTAAVA